MNSPQTINGLMRHLRNDCKIKISGSKQKQQLITYGYYHGYKGYRFVKNKNTQLPYTDFNEVVAVIEYDNELKASLYHNLMFIETALKSIICNNAVAKLNSSTFDYVYKSKMNDNTTDSKLQLNRLKLRNAVYSKLSSRYSAEEKSDNKMVQHFYKRGEDVPLWVIFEILYLSDLASFFECLNTDVRITIMKDLDLYDKAIDSNSELLSFIIYTIKTLRNCVAHNSIIFDTRFKDRNISKVLKKWVEKETNIKNITLYSLIDYIIIICCVLKRIDFSGKRANALLEQYKNQNQILHTNVSQAIYDKIIQSNVAHKINGLETYLNT